MSLLILFVSFCSFSLFQKICRKGKLAKDKPLDKQTLDDTPCALSLRTREFSTASIANYASLMIVYVSCDLHLQTVHNLSFALLLHKWENRNITVCEDCGYDKVCTHFSPLSISFYDFYVLSISFFGFGSSLKMDMFGQFGLSYVPFIPFPWPCKGPPPW
jgi:hypothetical protein